MSTRRVLFCVSDREAETTQAWAWAASRFLDPSRDAVTLLRVLSGGVVPLPPNERASEDAFPWCPTSIVKDLSAFASRPRYVEVSAPLLVPVGDAVVDWLTSSRPQGNSPDIIITGSRGHDTRLSRFFLGSVSSHLARNGEETVLVVRPGAQEVVSKGVPEPTAVRVVALALDAAADTARAQVRWALKYVIRPTDESAWRTDTRCTVVCRC